MENILSCPSCNDKNKIPFINCKDYTVSGSQFTINQCVNCELRYTDPRPAAFEIASFYESVDYVSHVEDAPGLINILYKAVRKRTLRQKIKLIRRNLKEGSLVLDFGAGTGAFLNVLSQNNYKTIGIEPSPRARDAAKRLHAVELAEPSHMYSFDKQQVNCITMWHVLEHIHQLKETLEQFNSILVSKGYLIIAVPNSDSFDAKHYDAQWAGYDVPRHLYHFNYKSLKYLIESYGFEFINRLPMLYDSTYVSMLSEKYKRRDKGKDDNLMSLIRGIFWGMVSNISGIGNKNRYSSHIYIFRKIN